MTPKGDIAVSFSGGLDTTLAVVHLLDHFERVHLNVYCNGFCVRVHASHTRVEDLRRCFGEERVICNTMSMKDILDGLLLDFGGDMRRTGSPLIFDLCCRMSMEIATLEYCLDNGISHAADGLSCAQPVIFILEPDYIAMADRFMAEYKVQFLYPVYHSGDRAQRRQVLEDYGLNSELKPISFLQRFSQFPQISDQILRQPFCYAQVPIFLLTSSWRDKPVLRRFGLPLEQAKAYREERHVLARELLSRRFEERGKPLDALLEGQDEPHEMKHHFPQGI